MARLKPLFSRLFLPYVAVSLGTVSLLLAVIGTAYRNAELDHIEESLTDRVRMVLPLLPQDFQQTDILTLDSLLRSNAEAGSFRLTLTDASGTVLAETDTIRTAMPGQQNRPEMLSALIGRTGTALRRDHVFDNTYSFVAIPIMAGGEVVGVLRGAKQVKASRWDFLTRTAGLVGFSIFLIGFGVALIFVIVRRVSKPLKELQEGADQFAQGKLEARLDEPDTSELAALARALNYMAAQLNDRIRAIEQQREEQEAVLSSMLEGVLAVDRDAQIIMMNAGAARLFDTDAEKSKGRALEEAIRNTDIQAFVRLTLAAEQPVEREFIRYDNQERILLLRGTPILVAGELFGVVVVINDVTQMRRLEAARRDFVANASHELKTPVTAICGSIETLREGALDNPADAARFLDIIARQADYLQAIIEDLLSLARIEQATEHKQLAVEQQPIAGILQDAVEATSTIAEARGQRVSLDCPADLLAEVNGFLVRQAVVNLIDNACKYSPEGTEINVRAHREGQSVLIAVQDRGPGIAEKHLSRIFERFYRVEASRNRKFGGTGLGLAIVKHAALAHGGSAEVDTQLGRGSTFFIRLPLKRAS